LAGQGNALASRVYVGFVEAVADKGGVLPPPQSVAGVQIARMVYESESCVAVVNRLLPEGNAGLDPRVTASLPSLPSASPSDGVWDYGLPCGRISLTVPANDPDAAAWAKARIAAISAMVEEMRASGTLDAAATAAVQGPPTEWPSGVPAYLDALGRRYDAASLKAAGAFLASRDRARRSKLVEHARAEGWLAAGEMWTTMRDLSQAVAAEANRLPDRQGVRLVELGRRNGLADLSEAAKAAYGRVQAELAADVQRQDAAKVMADDLASQGDANANTFQRLVAPLTRPLAAWALADDEPDAWGATINLGHTILAAVETTVIGGAGVAALAGNGVASLAGGATVFQWLASPVLWLIAILTVVGAVLAYVVPVLPFIYLFYHAVSWIVAVLECLIAVPIWLLLWVRFDGAELVDNPQKMGVIYLFNLLLRPVLGVLGLIGAYYVLPLALTYLRKHFGTAFLAQQGGHVVGIVGVTVGLLLLAFLTHKASVRILELVANMADRIGRWFGSPPERMGDAEATTQVVGASIQAGQRLEHAGPRLPKAGGDGGGGDGEGGSVAGGRGGATGSIQRVGE
jgi:conjugal transfer/type IV secretion protein DotA/TraY